MRNQSVPLIPGYLSLREGFVNEKEFESSLHQRIEKSAALDRIQITILSKIIFPYWEKYLEAIAHHKPKSAILDLRFGWLDNQTGERSKTNFIDRIARVIVDTQTSVDLLPAKIIFQIELCRHKTPHRCLILHEGRGRYEIIPHARACEGMSHA